MKQEIRRLIALLLAMGVLLAACAPPSGVSVSLSCSSIIIRYQGNADNDSGDTYGITIFKDSADPSNIIASGSGPAGAGSHQVGFGFTRLPKGTTVIVMMDSGTVFSGPCGEDGDSEGVYIACQVGDGRVNSYDCAAPVAIYCTASNLDIYKIDPEDGNGDLIIRLPLSDLPDGTALPMENTTLEEVGNVMLSYLTDGKLQVNTYYGEGKAYVINWNGCPATNVQTLVS